MHFSLEKVYELSLLYVCSDQFCTTTICTTQLNSVSYYIHTTFFNVVFGRGLFFYIYEAQDYLKTPVLLLFGPMGGIFPVHSHYVFYICIKLYPINRNLIRYGSSLKSKEKKINQFYSS